MNGKEKRRILLWQMIVMAVLPLTIFISAFFVRINVNPLNIAGMYEDFAESALEQASDALGGLGDLGELAGLGGDYADEYKSYIEEAKNQLEESMKEDLTFTGWETVFPTDRMIMEKILRVTGETEDLEPERFEKLYEEVQGEESTQKLFSEIKDFLGYMRIGFLLLYILAAVVAVMAVIWFFCKLDGIALVITNLIVSIGGTAVTAIGIFTTGGNAAAAFEQAIGSAGQLGSFADMVAGTIEWEKPMRMFGIAINMTFGGIGCMIICAVMMLFAIYMMVDYFVLAKKRVVSQANTVVSGPVSGQYANAAMSPVGYESGKITVCSGEFAGAEMEIREGEEIILGRDPSLCHLVFTDSKISRKHCGVRYNPQTNTYMVKNYSMNGTRFASGQMVSSDVFVEVVPGNIIELADGREEVVLGP